MGTGHSSAAEAILRALQQCDPAIEGRVVDSFRYSSQFLGRVVEDGYLHLLRSFPSLYGLLYERRDPSSTVSRLRKWVNRLVASNFRNLFDTYRPDAIVCTHAFPFGVTSDVRETFGLEVPTLGVVTDFVVHPFWVYRNMDMYAVATPDLARQLTGRGLRRSSVKVTGIPIDPRFSQEPIEREGLREALGVNSGLPVVLVMGGGLAMGPVARILRSLRRISRPMHVVVLTGKNQQLRARLEAQLKGLTDLAAEVQVLGYVENVYDYMRAADLLVTKPGGLTAAEALASALPMLIVSPLPGQEMRNSKYLLGKNAAVRVTNERSLPRVIESMLESPDALRRLQAVSRKLARPDAAHRVASLILELLATPRPGAAWPEATGGGLGAGA